MIGEYMKIVGLMIARDEENTVGLAIDSASNIIDELVYIDNMSMDRTPQIVFDKCTEHGIKIYTVQAPLSFMVAHLRRLALQIGIKHTNADWFYTVDADMVFDDKMDVRSFAAQDVYDQFFFRTLNLVGDVSKRKIGSLNIPHMWLFRNRPGMKIFAGPNYAIHDGVTDPNKDRFLGWNLNGIKPYSHIFWRTQIMYSRRWNMAHNTNMSVEAFIKMYFPETPTEDYKKTYILNRLRHRCMNVDPGMDRYLNYTKLFNDWQCPFELILDNNGDIIGRTPDMIDVDILHDEDIFQLTQKQAMVFQEMETKGHHLYIQVDTESGE